MELLPRLNSEPAGSGGADFHLRAGARASPPVDGLYEQDGSFDDLSGTGAAGTFKVEPGSTVKDSHVAQGVVDTSVGPAFARLPLGCRVPFRCWAGFCLLGSLKFSVLSRLFSASSRGTALSGTA